MNNFFLPTVTVHDSPYTSPKRKSSGIVLYCRSTKKWLVIGTKDSSGIVALCRGQYHLAHLIRLLTSMRVSDIQRVIESAESVEHFRSLCESVEGKCIDHVIEYAYDRLINCLPTIRMYLERKPHTEMSCRIWPKGKPRQNSETELDTALRELKEETGVDLETVDYQVVGRLQRSYITYTNLKYEDVYIICSIDQHIDCAVTDHSEVSVAEWIGSDELERSGLPLYEKILEMTV